MSQDDRRPSYRVLTTRIIVVSGVTLFAVGVGIAVFLIWAYGGDAAADRAKLDAIKTAGTIVAGIGGAAALVLAARRQRAMEIALRQKDAEVEATERDAAERRVTDLYTRAVEQLGSEKAPVRLGGMYALERLAQNVPEQRQTIVNVLCAYLRMPYEPLAAETGGDVNGVAHQQEYERREQERQVRLTAQRILIDHLRPNDSSETFWPDIDLDLTNAKLTDCDISRCRIRTARFTRAVFTGYANFEETQFTESGGFSRANFNKDASFANAHFQGHAGFDQAWFVQNANFGGTQFDGAGSFKRTHFQGRTDFGKAGFVDFAYFEKCEFVTAIFEHARFGAGMSFERAKFTGKSVSTARACGWIFWPIKSTRTEQRSLPQNLRRRTPRASGVI